MKINKWLSVVLVVAISVFCISFHFNNKASADPIYGGEEVFGIPQGDYWWELLPRYTDEPLEIGFGQEFHSTFPAEGVNTNYIIDDEEEETGRFKYGGTDPDARRCAVGECFDGMTFENEVTDRAAPTKEELQGYIDMGENAENPGDRFKTRIYNSFDKLVTNGKCEAVQIVVNQLPKRRLRAGLESSDPAARGTGLFTFVFPPYFKSDFELAPASTNPAGPRSRLSTGLSSNTSRPGSPPAGKRTRKTIPSRGTWSGPFVTS